MKESNRKKVLIFLVLAVILAFATPGFPDEIISLLIALFYTFQK